MTLYINFRRAAVGGGIAEPPYGLDGDGLAGDQPMLRAIDERAFASRIAGNHLVLVVHGFNVSYRSGVRSAARLDHTLNLGPGYVVAGVLWPGDYWIPVINYPAEAADAVRCGRGLAAFLNRVRGDGQPVSLVSHSLGARVVLEAVRGLSHPAQAVCLTAGAVDDDVLFKQYAAATSNAEIVSVLASQSDKVLRLAYPLGDAVSDILYDDDSPLRSALGRKGSRPARMTDAHIAKVDRYDHGDYFPPGDLVSQTKWLRVADHLRNRIQGTATNWPAPGAR